MGNSGLHLVLNCPDHPGIRIKGVRISGIRIIGTRIIGIRIIGIRIIGIRITEGPLYKGYQFYVSF